MEVSCEPVRHILLILNHRCFFKCPFLNLHLERTVCIFVDEKCVDRSCSRESTLLRPERGRLMGSIIGHGEPATSGRRCRQDESGPVLLLTEAIRQLGGEMRIELGALLDAGAGPTPLMSVDASDGPVVLRLTDPSCPITIGTAAIRTSAENQKCLSAVGSMTTSISSTMRYLRSTCARSPLAGSAYPSARMYAL